MSLLSLDTNKVYQTRLYQIQVRRGDGIGSIYILFELIQNSRLEPLRRMIAFQLKDSGGDLLTSSLAKQGGLGQSQLLIGGFLQDQFYLGVQMNQTQAVLPVACQKSSLRCDRIRRWKQ